MAGAALRCNNMGASKVPGSSLPRLGLGPGFGTRI